MARHSWTAGRRVLWNCAFSTPEEVEIIAPDGFGPNGEPEYLVRHPGDDPAVPGWVLPEHVLHPIPYESKPLAPLLGLVGKKRSGKDSIASVLVEHFGFTRVAFADKLKAIAYDLNPEISRSFINHTYRLAELVDRAGWEEAKDTLEVRRILQALGVAVRDHLGEDQWVAATRAEIQSLREAGTPVVVTDVRFPNELEATRNAGGMTWRVVRPGMESVDQHVSETALDGVSTDYVIYNNCSLEQLQGQVNNLALFFGWMPTKLAPRREAA